MTIAEFITGVTVNISNKTQPNSIPPGIVGGAFVNLALLLSADTTPYVFDNGIQTLSGVTGLGGSLQEDTSIDIGSNDFTIGTSDNNFCLLSLLNSQQDATLFGGTPASYGFLAVGIDGSNLTFSNDSGLTSSGIVIGNSSMLVQDTMNSIGFANFQDYSAKGMMNPLWLAQWGAVTSAITSSLIPYYTSGQTNSILLPISTGLTFLDNILTGGTAGQVLSKINGTNYNFQWINQSGGSSSGASLTAGVTLTGGTYNGLSATTFDINTNHPNLWTGIQSFDTPVFIGLPTGSGVATTATGHTLVSRDANANTTVNNLISSYAVTTTAGGVTTLTVSSAYQQFFTGSTNQTVKLPVTSTLVAGQQFRIVNNGTGLITVQSSGSNTITTLSAGTSVVVTVALITGTTAASWYYAVSNYTFGGGLTNSGGTITLGGTLPNPNGSTTNLFDNNTSIYMGLGEFEAQVHYLNSGIVNSALLVLNSTLIEGTSWSIGYNRSPAPSKVVQIAWSSQEAPQGIAIQEDNYSIGMTYTSDYSSNGISNPLWIPNYNAVLVAITGVTSTIIPSQTDNEGLFLTTDGTNLSWGSPGGGGSGLTVGNFVIGETPGGTIDGLNTNFSLAYVPTNGPALYKNGVRLATPGDYTIIGAGITYTVAPLVGSVLLADYMK